MDSKLKQFLKKHLIPDTVTNLLELYGINFLNDLHTFDEGMISDIERSVRDDEFSSRVDFSSRKVRAKYLGSDASIVNEFKFRPLEKKKLLKLQGAALASMEKKRKFMNEMKKGNEAERQSRIIAKILNDCNKLLSGLEDFEGNFNESHVHGEIDPIKEIFVAKVECVVCGSTMKLNSTKYTVSCHNLMVHMQRLHMKKDATINDGSVVVQKRKPKRMKIEPAEASATYYIDNTAFIEAKEEYLDNLFYEEDNNEDLSDDEIDVPPHKTPRKTKNEELIDEEIDSQNKTQIKVKSEFNSNRLDAIVEKVVNNCNNYLLCVENCHEQFNKTHVCPDFDPALDHIIASINCVLCGRKVKLGGTKFSVNCVNYKKHLKRVHMKNQKIEQASTSSIVIETSETIVGEPSNQQFPKELLKTEEECREDSSDNDANPSIKYSDVQRLVRIVEKVVKDCNMHIAQVYNLYNNEVHGKIEKSHVCANYDPVRQKISASVKCLLCSAHVRLNSTKYSISIQNYRHHTARLHLKKEIQLDSIK